jgi:hypothetical protein
MRIIFILFLNLLSYSLLFAQTRDDKNTEIEIGYGASFPTGDFKSTDATDSLARFAMKGTQVRGSMLFLFSKYVGVEFKLMHATNGLDDNQLREKYKSLAASLNGTVSSFSSDRWKYTSYALGPCFNVRLRNFGFGVDVLAGITNSTMPEMELAIYDSTQAQCIADCSGVSAVIRFWN